MSIIAKRIGKKTFFLLLSISAFAVAFFVRLFFGGSHINLSQLESKASDIFGQKDKMISVASADAPTTTPPPGGGSAGEGGSDGCSSGGCAEGAEGSEGSY